MEIEALGFRAEGMARIDGWPTLVPHGLPGERVEVEVQRLPPFGALRARLLRVVDPAPERVDPGCTHYSRCGGCHLRHVRYADELGFKRANVADAAGRLAGAAVDPVQPASRRDGHRARCRAEVVGGVLVMRPLDPGLAPVPVSGCPALVPELRDQAAAWPSTRNPGPDDDGRVRLSTGGGPGWTAPNPEMGATVARVAAHLLGSGERLLEVGCGSAGLTVCVAPSFGRLVGLDIDPAALAAGRQRVDDAGLASRVELRAGRVEKVWRRLLVRFGRFDAALVNPMRRPLGRRAMAALVALGVRRVVYVGPSPRPTCADLQALAEHGLQARRLVPVDLYPGTYHVVTVALAGAPGPLVRT